MACSREPISGDFGYRYRFSFWRMLLAGITSSTKIGSKRMVQGELNTYNLLFEFSKIYHIDFGEEGAIMEIPKKVRDLDARLKLNLFPM